MYRLFVHIFLSSDYLQNFIKAKPVSLSCVGTNIQENISVTTLHREKNLGHVFALLVPEIFTKI